jgi:hypothetical protein
LARLWLYRISQQRTIKIKKVAKLGRKIKIIKGRKLLTIKIKNTEAQSWLLLVRSVGCEQ